MRTRGAIVASATAGKYEVVELELDDNLRPGELHVRMVASGLCHTDDHFVVGDIPVATYPLAGGHEGSGVIERVGENTPGFEVGDHVVLTLPQCGHCRWCSSGMQNLCDLGAHMLTGTRFDDPTSYRLRTTDGQPVAQMCGISTFVEQTVVSALSAVKIDRDLPMAQMSVCWAVVYPPDGDQP